MKITTLSYHYQILYELTHSIIIDRLFLQTSTKNVNEEKIIIFTRSLYLYDQERCMYMTNVNGKISVTSTLQVFHHIYLTALYVFLLKKP